MEYKPSSTKPSLTFSKKEVTKEEFFGYLFQIRNLAHLAHLKTKSFSEHKALNDFYEKILEFTDELFEGTQGEELVLFNVIIPLTKLNEDSLSLIKSCKLYINNNRNIFKESWQQNVIDEIMQLISSTLYKLNFLK